VTFEQRERIRPQEQSIVKSGLCDHAG
jgi:hypothetical protein